ncbi:50S ribosomal protein L24 [Candidatus Woesebacteria bacterium RIFCSPHIGHO2_01_FULL_44_21]|uniref:Large ribosomal subunit protein uL24 n=1 Tax=Candidatus Woesebacteria bacterium RIFCSPHIGHO2_01_FULL_44_21 TaxID=1802503 RepID=A0A1F7Z1M7_9BACT|nr:MAG: 50S ribosomal protein L24 [Candidatus Woesebacteria bacterium RIFCSPHIGHO2_01_FULL_44_21]OGM71477.1 MAG: 50S ribosomal protein L24 [Candidatus Woesebacteria bacterium RIFCSPLOWO2_01_FULL_44_24b]
MNKFKVGDKVRVRSGKDRGREGTIEAISSGRALIQGINIYKKHVKKSVSRDNKGGIFDIPRPVLLSKLAVLDPKTGKPTRVGFRIEGDRKVRISKRSGVILDKLK